LHGPHHSAQKSTNTGLPDASTSDAKSLSPTDLVAMFISFVAPHVCPLPNADKRQGR
jgi:hypothetical protein